MCLLSTSKSWEFSGHERKECQSRKELVNQVPKQQYIHNMKWGSVVGNNNNVRYGTSFFCRFKEMAELFQ
jgi:hypothetical protein